MKNKIFGLILAANFLVPVLSYSADVDQQVEKEICQFVEKYQNASKDIKSEFGNYLVYLNAGYYERYYRLYILNRHLKGFITFDKFFSEMKNVPSVGDLGFGLGYVFENKLSQEELIKFNEMVNEFNEFIKKYYVRPNPKLFEEGLLLDQKQIIELIKIFEKILKMIRDDRMEIFPIPAKYFQTHIRSNL